jgi:hypothetical protein
MLDTLQPQNSPPLAAQTVAAVFRFSSHSSVTKTQPKSLEPVHPFFILYYLLLPLLLIFIFLFLVLTEVEGLISVACISASDR